MKREAGRLLLNAASFGVMVVLIFIAMNLVLSGWWSTGPNQYIALGLTGWLDLHRYQFTWTIEHFHAARLAIEISIAVLGTWLLSKLLHLFPKGS